MAEYTEGVVSKIVHTRDGKPKDDGTPNLYANYNVAFTDGTTHVLNVLKTKAPKEGQKVRLEAGRFGQMNLVKEDDGGSYNGSTPSSNGSSNGNSNGYAPRATKDDYFRDKAHYDEKVRDPQIARQTWARMAVDTYNAGLQFQQEVPTTPEELDVYFQKAVNLGDAVYQIMSKK